MLRSQFSDLTPLQAAVVSAIFFLTLCGAIAAALAFRWWNSRSGCGSLRCFVDTRIALRDIRQR
jgi:hypothetical protein